MLVHGKPIMKEKWYKMGKTEKELKNLKLTDEMEDTLPEPLPGEIKLHEMYSGNFVAIVENRIVAVDPSIEKIHEKVDSIVPKDKICRIRFIDNGVGIYGFTI